MKSTGEVEAWVNLCEAFVKSQLGPARRRPLPVKYLTVKTMTPRAVQIAIALHAMNFTFASPPREPLPIRDAGIASR
jgi:hypothetical protein